MHSPACTTQTADLSEVGGDVGLLFNGAMLFSPYGGAQYGKVTGYTSSATYAEGSTFDLCGCHASQTLKEHCNWGIPPCDQASTMEISGKFQEFPGMTFLRLGLYFGISGVSYQYSKGVKVGLAPIFF